MGTYEGVAAGVNRISYFNQKDKKFQVPSSRPCVFGNFFLECIGLETGGSPDPAAILYRIQWQMCESFGWMRKDNVDMK
jgi:hypothetical protein